MATWYFLDPQGAEQGPYHRLQMRQWFEKRFFEPKTPVREAESGPFTMLGEVFAGEFVEAFLDADAKDTLREAKERNALIPKNRDGVWKDKSKKVAATEKNPFPNDTFESPGAELYVCCACAKVWAAKALLEAGVDPNWSSPSQETCLAAAAIAGNSEIIRALVEYGAEVNAENLWHMTAMHEAARYDRPEAIRTLFELGASLEIRDLDGYKPIHSACSRGSADAVRELIRLGSSSTVRDNHNWTPVMHALKLEDPKIKAKLVQLISKEVE